MCDILTEAIFNGLASTSADALYGYSAFCTAVAQWNGDGGNSAFQIFAGADDGSRRAELAAFLGNVLHESGDFVYPRETSQCGTTAGADGNAYVSGDLYCQPGGYRSGDGPFSDPYCSSSHNVGTIPPGCTCSAAAETLGAGYLADDLFFGRGPIQLSWNYNYYSAGQALGEDLCGSPELVATDSEIAWGTAIWFWTRNTGATGTTCRDAVVANGSFGQALNTINGGLECTASTGHRASIVSRLDDYCRASGALGATALLSLGGCTELQDVYDSCIAGGSQAWGSCGSCDSLTDVTDSPTSAPTSAPTNAPTSPPTKSPVTDSPTSGPTAAPTNAPTKNPITNSPTGAPTSAPTKNPATDSPTSGPTSAPTGAPINPSTNSPTRAPTSAPTSSPTNPVTDSPTSGPTSAPTGAPTNPSTNSPTRAPISAPTSSPTNPVTSSPTSSPVTAGPTTSTHTNKWFVDGTVCKKDCSQSDDICASASRWAELFDTAAGCCSAKLKWANQDWCQTRSDPDTHGTADGAYTDMWFVDYGNSLCVKDCGDSSDPSCGDLRWGTVTALFDTAAGCCSDKLGWIASEGCETRSEAGADADPTGTDKWYADYAAAKRCVKDCAPGGGDPACGGIAGYAAGVSLYDDALGCCVAKFGWYDGITCQAKSESGGDAATGRWYANFADNLCVRDCAFGSADDCGGTPDYWGTPMFDTATACCAAKLGWIDGDACAARSENGANAPPVGTDKWYAAYADHRCAKDCTKSDTDVACDGVVDANLGLQMYESVDICCSSRLAWMDGDFCKVKSETGGTGYSNQWYPDQGKGVCHKDCDESGGGQCNGSPTDLSVRMYSDAASCCAGSLSWADAGTCMQVLVSNQGSAQWYVNWKLYECIKDCDPSTGDSECGGVKNDWGPMYSSASECCGQMSWKEFDDCKRA